MLWRVCAGCVLAQIFLDIALSHDCYRVSFQRIEIVFHTELPAIRVRIYLRMSFILNSFFRQIACNCSRVFQIIFGRKFYSASE